MMSKSRNWGLIVYPESAPNNWVDIIKDWHIKCAISPLHDSDVTSDGTLKKAHYHVLLALDGPKTENHVHLLVSNLNGTKPIKIQSLSGYFRYLIHADDKDKYQYSQDDIKIMGNWNPLPYLDDDKSPKEEVILNTMIEISHFINTSLIYSYSDLLDYAIKNNKRDWYQIISKHSYHFNLQLRDNYFKISEEQRHG